jgi:hypothetical protein
MWERDDHNSIQDPSIYSGGDGSSIEAAVVITTTHTAEGIQAEYDYISNIYGQNGRDWKPLKQALLHHADKPYDALSIVLSSGDQKTLYFDIHQFFGKT